MLRIIQFCLYLLMLIRRAVRRPFIPMGFSVKLSQEHDLVITFGFFDVVYCELCLDFNQQFFPCDPNIWLDILAFFNGGIRQGHYGYSFLSDQGLLHFAFLTNSLWEHQAKWRLRRFHYDQIRKHLLADGWF